MLERTAAHRIRRLGEGFTIDERFPLAYNAPSFLPARSLDTPRTSTAAELKIRAAVVILKRDSAIGTCRTQATPTFAAAQPGEQRARRQGRQRLAADRPTNSPAKQHARAVTQSQGLCLTGARDMHQTNANTINPDYRKVNVDSFVLSWQDASRSPPALPDVSKGNKGCQPN